MNFDELSRAERLIAEQAVLNLRTLNAACNDAVEHIAETSRAVFGAETNEASIWKQRGWSSFDDTEPDNGYARGNLNLTRLVKTSLLEIRHTHKSAQPILIGLMAAFSSLIFVRHCPNCLIVP